MKNLPLLILFVLSFSFLAEAEDKLICNALNYKDFIYDSEKMDQLLAQGEGGCNLQLVDWRNQIITDGDFREADFKGALFSFTDLSNGDFRGADFRGTLMHAWFDNSDLRGALIDNLDNSVLRNVNMEGVDLSEVRFFKVFLEGANLIAANLEGATFQRSLYSSKTKFPVGFQKPWGLWKSPLWIFGY